MDFGLSEEQNMIISVARQMADDFEEEDDVESNSFEASDDDNSFDYDDGLDYDDLYRGLPDLCVMVSPGATEEEAQ